MTRQERIENKGYKLVFSISGKSVFAKKGFITIKGNSITDLHRQIFGY